MVVCGCIVVPVLFWFFVFFVYQRRDGPFFSISFRSARISLNIINIFSGFFFSSSSKIHKQIRLGET